MLTLQGRIGRASGLAFLADGRTLALAAGQTPNVRLYSLETGKLTRRLSGHRDQVTAMAGATGAPILATAGKDCEALVWNADGEEVARTRHGDYTIRALALSADGRFMALPWRFGAF